MSIDSIITICIFIITGAVSVGVLKAQINTNTNNIKELSKNLLQLESIKMNIEINKRDIEVMKNQGYEDRATIRNILAHNQTTEIQLTKILEQLKNIEKKLNT